MKLTIARIEEHVVTCELEDGTRLDIDRKWLDKGIEVGNSIEVDVQSAKNTAQDRLREYDKFNNDSNYSGHPM